MRRVAFISTILLLTAGLLLWAAPSARAEEPILLARARILTDAELETVTGGEAIVCGAKDRWAEVCDRSEEGPSTQIILWDEYKVRTPRVSSSPLGAGPRSTMQSNVKGTTQLNSTSGR